MGKKYLNTKEGSIEQSVLDVWQEAADMHDEGMDGRTKEYRSHRGKLESNRVKRENKKSSVKTEQPETLDGAGEHAFEVGTDRYREHTQKMTPGQTEEGIIGNLAKAGVTAVGKKIKSTAKSAYGKTIVGKAHSAVAKKVKKVGGAIKRVKQAAKTGEEFDFAEMEKENMTENRNLVNTIKNLWIEAAAAAVDPNDREELDLAPEDTAKKMKRAKEPAPNVSEEVGLDEASGDKEAYKKFFNAALKKFKVSSPAELKGDDKKKFFDYIDKNWEADNEKAEAAMSQVREFKIQSMKAALAQVWGMEEGKNPFKTENDEKDDDDEKKGNTMTGKKKATVDVSPHQSYH